MFILSIEYWMAFACGSLLGILVNPVMKRLLRRATASTGGRDTDRSSIYGLEHGILNLKLPLPSMWMNLGFWEDQVDDPKDLPRACQALLTRVLRAAFEDDVRHPVDNIQLLDVGIGCADQSIFLLTGMGNGPDDRAHQQQNRLPKVTKYVGITDNVNQYEYAHTRLRSLELLERTLEKGPSEPSAKIFCTDAAQPSCWPPEAKKATANLRAVDGMSPPPQVWLLGLDAMFHFAPSRLPLLRYAHDELQASLMAFELILAEGVKAPNFAQRFLLRLVCMATSTPYGNFMTREEYTQLLVRAGYQADSITVEDVSEQVFEPLVKFLTRQDAQLRTIGQGIGAFRAARWVFNWWAKSGIVRGCIVVARRGR